MKCLYIIGPTASGKSDLAIALARQFSGEVISSDSRQIYRYMDLGTGKESGKIKAQKTGATYTQKAYISSGVPHYMIDTHHPNTDFSAGKFVKRAVRIREDIWSRSKLPIICGGTMFWAQSLLEGLSEARSENRELRGELRHESTADLLNMLRSLDERRHDEIVHKNEVNNRVRLVRAIEIASTVGHVPEEVIPDYDILNKDNIIIAIDYPKEILDGRIKKRLDKRIGAGMLDEVYELHHTHGVAWTRLENFGLEYRWCTRYLRGEVSEAEFRERLYYDSIHYAKRQKTWMKRWQKRGAKVYFVENTSEAMKLIKKRE